jgi:hypothetical protein
VDQHDAAQVMELVRALRERLHEMTCRLVRVGRQGFTLMNSPASAIRCERAELRRDISEAQILVNRLERHYLNSNGYAEPRLPKSNRGNAINPN